ncbi:MAG: response regulator [Candidatus Goldiibacteriota bacterium]
MKILLIDDSPMQQKIARIYIEKGEGHQLLTANNGEEGIQTAKEELPVLILLDVDMPKMNGMETLKALKGGETTKDIPVIMCTGNEDEELKKQLLDNGAVSYIKKPHGFSTLKNMIKNILE